VCHKLKNLAVIIFSEKIVIHILLSITVSELQHVEVYKSLLIFLRRKVVFWCLCWLEAENSERTSANDSGIWLIFIVTVLAIAWPPSSPDFTHISKVAVWNRSWNPRQQQGDLMEAVRASETSVNFYQIKRRNIPENFILVTTFREETLQQIKLNRKCLTRHYLRYVMGISCL
jgi:hypothetical protein